MPYEIDWKGNPHYVCVRLTGVVTDGELAEALRVVVQSPQWQPGRNLLWDGRDITLLDMEMADYDEINNAMLRLRAERGGGRSAMLVRRKAVELLARYVKAAGIRYGPDTEREVFTSLAEAKAWLRAA